MKIGNVWKLPFESKRKIGFIFINNNIWYVGTQYNKPEIDCIFNLITKYLKAIKINFNDAYYIT